MAKHLTYDERIAIAQLHGEGWTQLEIAGRLGRAASTICRELSRNATEGCYHADPAQQQARRRRQKRPLVRKMDRPKVNDFVRGGLARYWSPDQIAGRLRLKESDPGLIVCAQTIYRWILRQPGEDRAYWKSYLRRRGRRPWKRRNQPTAAAASIASRPAVIEQRRRLGDFEGDTVLGAMGTGG